MFIGSSLGAHYEDRLRNMNLNGQDLYQLVNHSRQSIVAHRGLEIMAPMDNFSGSLDIDLWTQGSRTGTRRLAARTTQSQGLRTQLLRRRVVVRGGLSLGLILALLCFGAICFLCMVGPQNIRVGSPSIDKGRFSDNRSIHLFRNVP